LYLISESSGKAANILLTKLLKPSSNRCAAMS